VLYTLYSHGFTSNKPHVKSAKVDGAVIGELWPHGSEYSTIVRMSQPWVNNLPEVDFHGGNGSLQGGPDAASSRYTECRLATMCEEGFFSNIKKDVVKTITNFSNDMQWPIALPAIFPRLFVNGSQGIGYTISNDWEPGNLREFKTKVEEYLATKKVDCSNIYPDYPTGGIIINKKDIHEIYETGKGTVILRAKATVEDNTINIFELPYQVYAEPVIQSIKDLVNAEILIGIEDICNMSDEKGLHIKIICSSDPTIILNQLYAKTALQCTFSANQMALSHGEPIMFTLKDYIKEYVDFNIGCLIQEYTFDLDRAEKRLEIVSGLTRALDIIDDIIAVIKKSKSSEVAKGTLVKDFKFTENQAKAIVDMRLGKLASLEGKELKDEETDLNKTIKACNKFLTSSNLQQKEFLKRLADFTDKYGWERRTAVDDIDIVKEKSIVRAATKIEDEYILALTKGNCIKKVLLANYKPQTKVVSEADKIISTIKVGAKDKFILVSASGIMYKLPVNIFKVGSLNASGENLDNILNDKILNIFTGEEENEFIFFTTKMGQVKKMQAADVLTISKKIGTPVMKLDSDDTIIDIRLIDAGTTIAYTVNRKEKVIETDKFRCKGRLAGGVACIKIKSGQEIII